MDNFDSEFCTKMNLSFIFVLRPYRLLIRHRSFSLFGISIFLFFWLLGNFLHRQFPFLHRTLLILIADLFINSLKYLLTESSFLLEVRNQFNHDTEIKSRLDNKGQNMISMSGTITTLFMGFGTFLLNQVATSNIYFSLALFFLLGEIILTVFTVGFSIRSYRIKEYSYPFGHEHFLIENVDGKIRWKEENIKEYTSDAAGDEKIAKAYLISMEKNKKELDKKAANIEYAQWTFLASVVIIPLFVFMILATKFHP